MDIINTTHHDIFVDEASSIPCRLQMRVFFCAGNSDIPDLFPGIIKLNMHWIDPWMVWSHCIAHVSWNTMFLKQDRTTFKNLRNFMFGHFANSLIVEDREQVWNTNNGDIKIWGIKGRWRQNSEDKTQDFNTWGLLKIFLLVCRKKEYKCILCWFL